MPEPASKVIVGEPSPKLNVKDSDTVAGAYVEKVADWPAIIVAGPVITGAVGI
jgi:hypothetical protein